MRGCRLGVQNVDSFLDIFAASQRLMILEDEPMDGLVRLRVGFRHCAQACVDLVDRGGE